MKDPRKLIQTPILDASLEVIIVEYVQASLSKQPIIFRAKE